MLDNAIMDHIDAGNFDRELGEIVRDPKYAEYTAMEIKAVLTDRISDNMLREHRYGIRRACITLVAALVVLLGVIITYN